MTENLSFGRAIEFVQNLSVGGAIELALLVVLYFLPTLFATLRKHHNVEAICVVNLFLGWTFVGWVVALAWALSVQKPPNA